MRFHWARSIFWSASALLLLSLGIPLVVKLNYWQQGIAAALSQGLGRPVRLGEVRLQLLGGPGFEIENVVVEEDPRFGIEPFVRMERLRASLRLRSLWQRQIQFSTLVFVRPSLNVVRNAAGHWNLESLGKVGFSASNGAQTSSGGSQSVFPLPQMYVESGRINFKLENRKQVHFIDDLDLELHPSASAHPSWRLQLEGMPSRTDFPQRLVSRFRVRAEFGPVAAGIQEETGRPVRLDLSAQDALLADWLQVFTGSDYGVHGSLNLECHLVGTTSLLRLSGRAELRDLHRWDFLPPEAASVLRAEIGGLLDFKTNSLQLASASIPVGEGSVAIRGRVENLFTHPWPDLRVQLHEISLAPIAEIAKQFTSRLNTRFMGEGLLNGSVDIEGAPVRLSGSLKVSEGRLQEKDQPQVVRLSDFQVVFEGRLGRLGPVRANLGEGGELQGALQWDLEKPSLGIHLEGETVPLVPFLQWTRVSGSGEEPAFAQGILALRTDIAMRAGQPSQIRGWARVSDAVLNSRIVESPVAIADSRIEFQRGQIAVQRLSATVGGVELQGNLRAKLSNSESPFSLPQLQLSTIEFDGQVSRIDLANLAPLFLSRPTRFFSFRDNADRRFEFLRALRARGTLQAQSVSYRGVGIEDFQASVNLHDGLLAIEKFTGKFAGGTHSGKATIYLGPNTPSFTLQVHSSDVDLQEITKASAAWSGFFSGKLAGTVRLASTGRNLTEVLQHLGGSGEVVSRQVTLHGVDLTGKPDGNPTPDAAPSRVSLTASFQIAKQEVQINDLEVVPLSRFGRNWGRASGPPALTVGGVIGFDRKLDFVLQEEPGGPPYHWSGTLSEPHVGPVLSWMSRHTLDTSLSEKEASSRRR